MYAELWLEIMGKDNLGESAVDDRILLQ